MDISEPASVMGAAITPEALEKLLEELRVDPENLVNIEFVDAPRPDHLPDPLSELCRITGVTTPEEIGQILPAVASLSTSADETSPHLRKFEVVFGRDAIFVADFLRDFLKDRPQLMRTTLKYLAARLGLPRELSPGTAAEYDAREEEAGRVPHEIRDPEVDERARELTDEEGWGWPFYRSDDATLLFIQCLTRVALDDPSFLNEEVEQRNGETCSLGRMPRPSNEVGSWANWPYRPTGVISPYQKRDKWRNAVLSHVAGQCTTALCGQMARWLPGRSQLLFANCKGCGTTD